MANVITFRNEKQVVLFEHELQGQISDGQWENYGEDLEERDGINYKDYYDEEEYNDVAAKYYDHWKVWCSANVVVGENVGRNFQPICDDYDFASGDLIRCVGERMMKYVRLSLVFGKDAIEDLEYAIDLYGGFRGFPPEGEDSPYHERWREALSGYDIEEAERVANDESLFDWKDLLDELCDMKQIIRTYNGQ